MYQREVCKETHQGRPSLYPIRLLHTLAQLLFGALYPEAGTRLARAEEERVGAPSAV